MSEPSNGDHVAHESVLVVGETRSPDELPTSVAGAVLEGVAGMNRRDVVKVLHPDTPHPPPFSFDRHYSHLSWGAEGATEAILIWFGGAISQEILSRGFDLLIDKYGRRWRGEDNAPTLQGARAAAIQTVLRWRPTISHDELTVTTVTEDSRGWFEFELAAGAETFMARVEQRRHLAYVAWIRSTVSPK